MASDKQMNVNAFGFVIDDLLASFACGCRGVLTLPVEGLLIYPVIVVSVLFSLALLVQGHKKDVHSSFH